MSRYEIRLDPDCIARVGPGVLRKIHGALEGARLLAIGAVPGEIYSRPADFELGAPEPTTAQP